MSLDRLLLFATPFATLVLLLPTAGTRTVRIEASRDATLIEDMDGARANGSGPSLFAGRTGQGADSLRRGLIAFDVAAALPSGARVESVSLELYLSDTNSGPRRVALHRVLTDWSEGPSASSGGIGAPAQPGDVTWLHTSWDVATWPRPGGHYVARASAARSIGDPGPYAWASTRELVEDVRLWQHAPARNFGWILVGDESPVRTVKRFETRESASSGQRPVLVVRYR